MSAVTLEQIEQQLRHLTPEKLAIVSQFLTALTYLERDVDEDHRDILLAAESSLRRDWDTPEEDAAWSHL